MDSEGNIFHVAEVLWSKKAEIKDLPMIDLSELKIATHHACHYFKVHYKEDSIGNKRNPLLLDDLANACGTETIGWYDHKKTTCGAGFRQRYANLDLSLSVTADKLMSLKENDVDTLLHMCPNCQMQFDRYQPVIEKNLNTKFNLAHLNIAQFLALAMGADPYKVVGIQTHTVSPDKVLEKIKQASPVAV